MAESSVCDGEHPAPKIFITIGCSPGACRIARPLLLRNLRSCKNYEVINKQDVRGAA